MNRRTFFRIGSVALVGGVLYGVYHVLTTISGPQPTETPTSTQTPTPTPTPTPTHTPTSTPPSETRLRWISPDGYVLDGNALNPGKPVQLEEEFNDVTGPKHFEVFEIYDSIFDWLIRRYYSISPKAKFEAMIVKDWTALSDRQWQLPAPSEFRGHSTFMFRDDREKWSGRIASASIGCIPFKIGPELRREDGTLEVGVSAEFEGEMIFATDPRVSLILMFPWGRGEADLTDYLSKYLQQQFGSVIRSAFFKGFKEYLPSGLPKEWDISLSRESIQGSPEKAENFALKIAAPRPGKTLLAVKAILYGDPSRFMVSEVLGVEGCACI